ncbi:Sfb3 protein [Saccharomycopsis crataegensis]|uniref:Sfb3 protein n=1 Tax=Saccharomycopsis crataegensis TaxID=43959 RepID=A0AAV5QU17_9ASCO|nr:Sfb3 protein [Saccharomycopsis crataegensis]
MSDTNFGSIDAQLSGLNLNDENSRDNSPVPAKSPAVGVKKKRPSRAYHILSPQLDSPNTSSGTFSPIQSQLSDGSQTSYIPQGGQFSPFQLNQPGFASPQSSNHQQQSQNTNSHLFSPTLNAFKNDASNANPSAAPYPSGTFSNPVSPPFSPLPPSTLQFQYLSEQQRGPTKSSTLNNSQRSTSRNVSYNMPDGYTGKPFQPAASFSVPEERAENQEEFWSKDYQTFQNPFPPLATTDCKVVDEGTASSKFMSLSTYDIPTSEKLRASTKLPVALNVRPFAPVEEDGDEPVPEVNLDFVKGGPPRCNRCRAYVNYGMQFTNANKFICNLCQFASPVPEGYSCALDHTYRRIDIAQRPELTKGVVDFVLPKKYWENTDMEPVPLHQVFLIDVSSHAMEKDLPRLVCDAINATLYSWNEETGEEQCVLPPGSKIAIITFDKNVQFYNMSPSLQQPIVTIMTDVADPFVPFHEGLFVDPLESRDLIDQTLTIVQNTNKFTRYPEVSYGVALKCAQLALNEFTDGQGGKVTCTLSMIPNYGQGMLFLKKYEDAGFSKDADKEKLVLQENNIYYKDLIKCFTKENVGLDLFVFPSFDMDLINATYITSHTGGSLKLYHGFNPIRDERKFVFDYKKSIGDTVGYQGHLKVRSSSGLQVQKYYGNFSGPSNDPVIPILNKNSNFSVLFSYDDNLYTGFDCHFQAAILYTTISGVRKIRVINLVSAVTEKVGDVFAFSNKDVLINVIVRDCLSHIPEQPLISIQRSINMKVSDIFYQYRRLVSPNETPAAFVVPDGLRTLPVYMLAFEKSRILQKITSMTKNNLRVYNMFNLNNLPLPVLSYYLYPYIVGLHDLGDDDCEYNEIYLKYRIPKGLSASLSSIEVGGCYLAFNGQSVILWVHNEVNPLLLQDLFGVDAFDKLDPLIDELPILDTHINQQVRNLIKYFGEKVLKAEFLPIKLLRFSLDEQVEFVELFVEDKAVDGPSSYGDYLSAIHQDVKERMNEKKEGFAKFTGFLS